MRTQLRSDTIKKLAMLFMAIDHIGGCIIEKIYLSTTDFQLAQMLFDINSVFRAIGRLAFPIFCYQIAIGAVKTKHKLKHFLLLLIFAIISEIPFDLASEWTTFYPDYQNTLFTLLLGTIAIYLIEWFVNTRFYVNLSAMGKLSEKQELSGKQADIMNLQNVCYILFSAVVILTLSLIAEHVKTDYGAKGVILIAAFYFFRNSQYRTALWGVVVFMALAFGVTYLRYHNLHSAISYMNFEAYGCLAFPIISMDNGERRGGRVLKWGGYIFYPAHLLIIYLIARMVV